MKTHPFFKGVNFEEVSKRKYKGLRTMIYDHYKIGEPVPEIKNEVVFKGILIKKNKWGNKQLRHL